MRRRCSNRYGSSSSSSTATISNSVGNLGSMRLPAHLQQLVPAARHLAKDRRRQHHLSLRLQVAHFR